MDPALPDAVLGQAAPRLPAIPWAALAPELVLFGTGILVLLLDTAGVNRLRASVVIAVAAVAAAVAGGLGTGRLALPLVAGAAALGQLLVVGVWRQRPRLMGAVLAVAGFAAAIGATAAQWVAASGAASFDGQTVVATQSLLGEMVAVDGIALFTRVTVCLAGIVTVPMGFAYAEERRIHRGEYYPLLLFAATGMTLLASSADLIMVFVSIEILSLSLYVLAGFAKRDPTSQESALKYFLLGAFSSALLLYGIALTYGVTGSTNLAEAAAAFGGLEAAQSIKLAALGLLIVGFGFKTALAPFHMWTPDVYQGAPTPVTGFMAAATKAAAFAAFLRVFAGAFAELQWSWQPALSVVAIVTMLGGAILAVVQTDLKRMLGYSAVAHAGYAVIGVIAVTRAGISGVLFYVLAYAFMALGAFGVLGLLERRAHKAMKLDDLRGLGRRSPVLAGLFALFLFALAGVPGTAGFTAKFAVFRAGVEAGFSELVVVAVISSAIAAFFYVRVTVAMFMDEAPVEAAAPPALAPSPGISTGLGLAAAGVVALGVVPGLLVDLATQAATAAA
jgi:NADH-quinone oxidoreductase subunit N